MNNYNAPHATPPGTSSASQAPAAPDYGMYRQGQAPPNLSAQRGKKKPKVFLIALAIILLIFAASLAVVFPKSDEFVLELGDGISLSPSDYLFGYGFVVDRGKIDAGGVDPSKAGNYQIRAELYFYNYTLNIRIQDTTPPEIIPYSDELYIATGRDYRPEDFAAEISDISGDVTCVIDYGGSESESISIPGAGEYSLLLKAEDINGNVGTREIFFRADEPPVIIGAFDRRLPTGADFDPYRVVAADSGDGEITENMNIDTGGFDPNAIGDYTITYSVSDSHGLTTEKAVTVSVCHEWELPLNGGDENISLGESEMKLLCDVGHFKYKPLDVPDYDAVVKLIEPALIDLKRSLGGGAYTAGSGCVYRITPEYIYFLSVRHVMKAVSRNCEIMFYNGTVVRETLDYALSQKSNELAMFRIPVSMVPVDTLMSLKQVYVDEDIYSKLSVGDEVVAYAKHWSGTDEDYVRRMTVRRLESSIGEFNLYNSLLETSEGVVGGMSGTAVVDLRGNLAGLASAYGTPTDSRYTVSSYHSRIDVLNEVETALEGQYSDKAA